MDTVEILISKLDFFSILLGLLLARGVKMRAPILLVEFYPPSLLYSFVVCTKLFEQDTLQFFQLNDVEMLVHQGTLLFRQLVRCL
jgi:hypothetical protein